MKSLLLPVMSVYGRELIQMENAQDLGREAENKASEVVRAGAVRVLGAEDHIATCSPGGETDEVSRGAALLRVASAAEPPRF